MATKIEWESIQVINKLILDRIFSLPNAPKDANQMKFTPIGLMSLRAEIKREFKMKHGYEFPDEILFEPNGRIGRVELK